jgi:uncharacterized protein YjiS (DUF1127 family)
MASHVLGSTTGVLRAPLSDLRQRLRNWRAQRQYQAQIARELAAYSARDLSDLGIAKGDIPAIVRASFRRV